MDYIGRGGPKGYRFLVVSVKNSVSILAVLVSYRVRVLHSSPELNMFF